jgi:ADP-ribosylglycohydrolase
MSPLPPDHAERMTRVRLALDGLSVGDAFGGRFFVPPDESRAVPSAPWPYSDDTEMALAIVSMLDQRGRIDPDELARDFARRYQADPYPPKIAEGNRLTLLGLVSRSPRK